MKHPIATLTTAKGTITIELYPENAPKTVASFIAAAKDDMYKNRLIKRIVPGFVLQPSYCFFDDKRCDFMIDGEFFHNGFNNPTKMEKWTVAMAGDGDKQAHGTEFFITLSDEAGAKLQDKFAAFGKVIGGFEEVTRLENVPTRPVFPEGVKATINQPIEDEFMLNVTIEE